MLPKALVYKLCHMSSCNFFSSAQVYKVMPCIPLWGIREQLITGLSPSAILIQSGRGRQTSMTGIKLLFISNKLTRYSLDRRDTTWLKQVYKLCQAMPVPNW